MTDYKKQISIFTSTLCSSLNCSIWRSSRFFWSSETFSNSGAQLKVDSISIFANSRSRVFEFKLFFIRMSSINVPWLDSEVNKMFSLEQLKWALGHSAVTEGALRQIGTMNATSVYPTSVYVGNQIMNLLLDMTWSIRSDDPNAQERSGEFFHGPLLTQADIENITGVAAYKFMPMENRIVRHQIQRWVAEVL